MVGRLIQRRRLGRGWSQTELATHLGTSQRQVSRWEGYRDKLPRKGTRQRIGQVLGITEVEWHRVVTEEEDDAIGSQAVAVRSGDEDFDPEMIVAYVEAKPGAEHQRRLKLQQDRLPRPSYVRWCVRLFGAWGSNFEGMLTALEIGQGVE